MRNTVISSYIPELKEVGGGVTNTAMYILYISLLNLWPTRLHMSPLNGLNQTLPSSEFADI